MTKSITTPLLQKKMIGHQQQVDEVVQAHAQGRLHHAWLINGQYSSGKATFACHFAKWLLQAEAGFVGSINPANGFPYRAQDKGVLKVEALTHPDFMMLSGELDLLESGKKQGTITVDEVRKAIQFSHMTPIESHYRVLVIDSVDDMNNNAANAVLKLLEEPPANMVLLLVSHVPGKILPTIRSRCRSLRFQKLSYQEFATIISHHHGLIQEEQIRELLELTIGSIRPALEILELGITDIAADIFEITAKKNIAKLQELATVAKKQPEYWHTISELLVNELRRQVRTAAREGKDFSDTLALSDRLQATFVDINKLHLDIEASLIASIS